MTDTMRLYHVSPTQNVDSIKLRGISPEFAQSKRKVIWLCESKAVTWALAHVSAKRGLQVGRLTVFAAEVPEELLICTRWSMVYQCAENVIIERAITADEVLRSVEHGMMTDVIPF